MVMKSEASTSSTPGQIRRPNPNTICLGSNSGLSPKNRSGSNDSGSLYVLGSRVNHLGRVLVNLLTDEESYSCLIPNVG